MTEHDDQGTQPCLLCKGGIRRTWKPIPGYSTCKASNYGQIRSADRTLADGTIRKGTIRKTRGTSYPKLNIRNDDGVMKTVEVHKLQMLAFEGPCPPGQTVRHLDDVGTHNHWHPGGETGGGNLAYGDWAKQNEDWARNHPAPAPEPKQPNVCACGQLTENASRRRCKDCIAKTGRDAARLLADGLSPDQAAVQLGYSSPDGLVRLARRYGGLVDAAPRYEIAEPPRRAWARRVVAWLGRKILGRSKKSAQEAEAAG